MLTNKSQLVILFSYMFEACGNMFHPLRRHRQTGGIMILDLLPYVSNWNAREDKELHLDLDAVRSKRGTFPILKKEPFTLHLTNVENRRLLIQGELDVTVSVPCDRCLTEVPTALHLVIDKSLPIEPAQGNLKEERMSKDPQEDDHLEQLEYMNGCQLDADRLVYGEILFAWPAKVLCRKDCKGICAKCGANLNETTCSCDQTAPDPRMAAFQDVFNKFKEV